MNTENRLWVDTKSARTRDSYLPPMCDAKLAESAETRKRSNSKRFGASPERCRIAQARSSAREGLLEEVRSPELMADCMQSFSSSQNIQSEMHNLDTNHKKNNVDFHGDPTHPPNFGTSIETLENVWPCSDMDYPSLLETPSSFTCRAKKFD